MSVNMIFDFGTTSLKVALVIDGVITAERNGNYTVASVHPKWVEQNPYELWELAGQLSKELVQEQQIADNVDHMLFIAPWKCLIPVANGDVLHPAIIWLDSRAQHQAEELNVLLSSHSSSELLTGQDYLPRLSWLKQQRPELWSSAQWIMGMNTFIKFMATGNVVTDPSDDFIRHNHIPLRSYRNAKNLVDSVLTSEELRKFPPSKNAEEVIGQLSPSACEHLGVSHPVDVINGFGDLPAITAGVGPVAPGATHIYIGTSSWLATVADSGSLAEGATSFTFDEDTRVDLYPLQTGGMAFDWIVEELYGHERTHLNSDFLDHINAIVDEVPAGSENLLAAHWLNGERTPFSKDARGLFINLNITHRKAHMVRAMMESICYTHRLSIESLEETHKNVINSVRVVGGGATSGVWMQMLADVLNRQVVVPHNPRYAGIIGGLKCINASHEGKSSFRADLPKFTGAQLTVYTPSSDATTAYERMYSTYTKLYPALETIFAELNTDPRDTYKDVTQ